MASVFGHAVAAIAIGHGFPKILRSWKFWILGIVCSFFPDLDVIGFKFGVSYESFWGHRGFTHSIVFSVLFGILITALFYRNQINSRKGLILILYFSLCTVSHALLDALTSGGYGVALFAPFDNSRFFFPWQPIQVSPIGIGSFFSEWGIRVLKSEAIWIGIPTFIFIILAKLLHRTKKNAPL